MLSNLNSNRLSFKRLPLALRAAAFVVLVCACFLVVEITQSIHAYRMQFKEIRAASTNLNRSVAQHVYDTVKETDVVLDSVVDTLEAAHCPACEMKVMRSFLVHRSKGLPQLHGFFVYDQTGKWLINSITEATIPLNNSDRDYFQYHRSNPDRGPYIGAPIRSKLTGEWILTVSRRLNDESGQFAGVALATVKMQYFQDFYNRLDIGEHGAIFVGRSDGTVLLRRPFDQSILGKNIADRELFKRYLSQSPNGIATIKSSVDGVVRINSYSSLPQYPLIISAALAEDEVFSDWRQDTIIRMLGVATLVVFLGWLGYRLAKQIQLRSNTENELQRAHQALESANQTLSKLAAQDGLTGLSNRREFDLALEREFGRALRSQTPVTLIMIDVDFFKQYNDTYGHVAGDQCLRTVADVIARFQRRTTDMTARFGGEEFVVLLPETTSAGALQIAEQIRLNIEQLQLPHHSSPNGIITISAGVASVVPDQQSIQPDLITAADTALYAAKNAGRNKICVFSDSTMT